MSAEREKSSRARPQMSEEFMLNSYKVIPCGKRYPHNWKRCPFAHEGESARRRDPRTHSYSDVMCPEARKGQTCPRGDACPFTHSLFEYWLLPSRFKTQLCSKRNACRRPFCFFAHDEAELREPGAEHDLSAAMEKCDISSMMHDSCGSFNCLPVSSDCPKNTLHAASVKKLSGDMHDLFYHQNSWELAEQVMPKMLPESLLYFMEQEVSSGKAYSNTTVTDADLESRLVMENLQMAMADPFWPDVPSSHSLEYQPASPSLQILKSLWAGRTCYGNFT